MRCLKEKKAADRLRLRRKMLIPLPANENWFVSLIEKILQLLFFKNLLNDCEKAEFEHSEKIVLGTSLFGCNKANKPDDCRIFCGYGQKTVMFAIIGIISGAVTTCHI
ncbi:hypothetical protein R83H12_02376 [Fibrobacteria bacterium R8-3-H12]